MLRSLLVGILAVSMAPACKGGGDAPAVQPGLAVGKVIELDGTVTATRDGKVRTLAANEEISGDDVIETNDGRVMIWLTFNNATWDLPPHRKERVSDGAAWKAEKVAQIPAAVQEATISGGRYAEKSAADTRESAAVPAAPRSAPPVAQEPPADVAAPADKGGSTVTTERPKVSGGERIEKSKAVSPTKPVAALEERGGPGGPPRDEAVPDAKRVASPPAPPVAQPTTPSSPLGGSTTDAAKPKEAALEQAASPGKQLALHQPALAKCLGDAARLPIKLVVKNGKASIVGTKLSVVQAKCFATVAATFEFDGTTNVELDYTVTK